MSGNYNHGVIYDEVKNTAAQPRRLRYNDHYTCGFGTRKSGLAHYNAMNTCT